MIFSANFIYLLLKERENDQFPQIETPTPTERAVSPLDGPFDFSVKFDTGWFTGRTIDCLLKKAAKQSSPSW
ncbi:MAG TPA: hypothetical protein VIR77_00525, partial [Pontiella sp.]